MADTPAAVADTHALIFHAAGTGQLGRAAASLFERSERQQAIIYVPAPVVWECSLLARVARVNLRRTVRVFFEDLFSNPAYQPVDLTAAHVYAADEMRFTRDPFDALICATAELMNLPLITRDARIRDSKRVRVVW